MCLCFLTAENGNCKIIWGEIAVFFAKQKHRVRGLHGHPAEAPVNEPIVEHWLNQVRGFIRLVDIPCPKRGYRTL